MLLLLILCAPHVTTAECQSFAEPTLQMQQELMLTFFAAIRQAYVLDISHQNPVGNVCGSKEAPSWEGISCVSGRVTDVDYTIGHLGFFLIVYLPATVQRLIIVSSFQRGVIQTRLLPRDALTVNFRDNRFSGAISLATLPRKLQELNVESNRLEGPISVIGLPASLVKLNLSDNDIKQKTVFYGRLPRNLQRVDLTLNEIRQTCSLETLKKNEESVFVLSPRGWRHEDRGE